MLCLLVLARDGWSIGLTPGALAVLVTVLVGMATATWGMFERHAGELRRGWALWGATAAVVVVGGWLAVTLRDLEPLGAVPVLLPLALCIGLLVVASRLPERTGPAPDPRALAVDTWFDRLGGLLRGRYYLPRRDVERHVADARAYWRESGAAHPADEFGAPAVYALRLVRGSREPQRGRRRAQAAGYAALALLWLAMVVGTLVEGGPRVDRVWRLAGLVLFAALAARGWRRSDDRPVA